MKIVSFLAIAVMACGTTSFKPVDNIEAHSTRPPLFTEVPASPIGVGPYAGEPAVADCNNDGNPDIIIACGTCCGSPAKPESGHLMVLLGDGRGNFTRAKNAPIKIASSARKIALADIDRDNRIDVLVAQHESYDVVILLGDGIGGFAPSPSSPVTAGRGARPHTHDITAADISGDGNPDFVTTNANDNNISIMLGNGKGSFNHAPGSPVAAGRHPYDVVALHDVDGDSKLDLITPNLIKNEATVMLGDGRGGFAQSSKSPFALGPRPGYIAVADLNGDGKADFVATHDDDPVVAVMLGDGTGGFQAAPGSPLRTEKAVWGTAIGDINGDRRLDLVIGSSAGHNVVILIGDGKGGFTPSERPLRAGTWTNYVALADFNKDGKLDIVASNYGSGDISVWLNVTE